tara:strand:- start:307 stop:918 length:612 start_codon:yes stop_codon:yes gene_type:complete
MIDIKNVNPTMLGKAAAFAGKGDWRHYLNGVYIEKRPEGGVYIVATNGHIMCVYADKKAVVENDFDPVTLKCHDDKKDGKPGGKVKTLFTDLKKANCGPVDIYEIGGNLTIDGNVVETIDGKIPDWKQVIPKAQDLNLEQQFYDTKYLKLLNEFPTNKKFPSMAFVGGSNQKASVWTNKDGLVLIMPMRCDIDINTEILKEVA